MIEYIKSGLFQDSPTGGSLDKGTAPTSTSASLPEEEAESIVRRTQERVSQLLARSKFITQQSRLQRIPSFSNSDLILGDIVATGGFSTIRAIDSFNKRDRHDGLEKKKNYVIKHLSLELASDPKKFQSGAKDLVMEAYFLSSICHKNILQLKGRSKLGVAGYAEDGRGDAFFLVFERLDMILSQKIYVWRKSLKRGRTKSFVARRRREKEVMVDRLKVLVDIATAITFLHHNRIIYRDLKPGNVGFDGKGTVKIFDFGLAVEVPRGPEDGCLFDLPGNTGTSRYMAPEIIRWEPYNYKADVFCFSVLMWEVMELCKPYVHLDASQVKELIALGNEREKISWFWPRPLRQLVERGWADDVELRPSMKKTLHILKNQLDESSQSTRTPSGTLVGCKVD